MLKVTGKMHCVRLRYGKKKHTMSTQASCQIYHAGWFPGIVLCKYASTVISNGNRKKVHSRQVKYKHTSAYSCYFKQKHKSIQCSVIAWWIYNFMLQSKKALSHQKAQVGNAGHCQITTHTNTHTGTPSPTNDYTQARIYSYKHMLVDIIFYLHTEMPTPSLDLSVM